MLNIPISAQPAQTFTIQLASQNCRLNVYQKTTGLFMDIFINDALVLAGVLCHDRNRIVRSTYLGFIGDLVFYDTQGTDDPVYSGLGSRWLLAYLEATDL